jgi:hypothetical protein
MNAVEGKETKAGKRAGNYGVCKAKLFKCFPYPEKRKILPATSMSVSKTALPIRSCGLPALPMVFIICLIKTVLKNYTHNW